MLANQKKPITAVSDVTNHAPKAFDINVHIFGKSITWDIRDAYHAVFLQPGFDRACGRFDPVSSPRNAAQVFESFDKSNRPVSAHAEIADIVKKYDARS